MKICENGIIRDMTAEEIAELERLAAEQPAPEPTPEERIAVLEEALNMLLSGVTERRAGCAKKSLRTTAG